MFLLFETYEPAPCEAAPSSALRVPVGQHLGGRGSLAVRPVMAGNEVQAAGAVGVAQGAVRLAVNHVDDALLQRALQLVHVLVEDDNVVFHTLSLLTLFIYFRCVLLINKFSMNYLCLLLTFFGIFAFNPLNRSPLRFGGLEVKSARK